MMYFLYKGFVEDYECWYVYGEVFVSNRRMGETVVGLIFSVSNVYEAVNDNINFYRNMVMDVMRMN